MTRDTTNALSFGKAVSDYELGRPSYPPEAVQWIVDALAPDMESPDTQAPDAAGTTRTFVDVGAGTGKFTASLLGRGADVIAVEPDPEMRTTLSTKFADVRALAGTGESLPLADGTADLITYAQAWHWVDEAAGCAEAARVLKPAGVLALVWNIRDDRVDWVARLTEIMGSSAAEDYDTGEVPIVAPLERSGYAEFFWDNPLTREQLLAMITSRSYIIAMEPAEREALLRRVGQLLDEHPQLAGNTTYVMPYVTRVTLARHVD